MKIPTITSHINENRILRDSVVFKMSDGRMGVRITRPAVLMAGVLKSGTMLLECCQAPEKDERIWLIMPDGKLRGLQVLMARPLVVVRGKGFCPPKRRLDFHVLGEYKTKLPDSKPFMVKMWERHFPPTLRHLARETGCGWEADSIEKLCERFDWKNAVDPDTAVFFGFVVDGIIGEEVKSDE